MTSAAKAALIPPLSGMAKAMPLSKPEFGAGPVAGGPDLKFRYPIFARFHRAKVGIQTQVLAQGATRLIELGPLERSLIALRWAFERISNPGATLSLNYSRTIALEVDVSQRSEIDEP